MVKFYKSLILLSVVCSLCMGFTGMAVAQSAEYKIGFVDLQRVIDASEVGKNARDEIQKNAEEFKAQADQMQAELEALAAEYKSQAEVLTAEAKREKQDEISRLELDLNRFVKDSQDELAMAEERALKQLLADIGKLIVEYGEQNGFSVILEAGNILYGSESIEITSAIIDLYNSQNQ